ncbi:MAG TPA: hypothetical protein VHI78_12635 [Bacteroidales bacterium]|nr:hypothetical protein [Bacteroidales bacterium]
MKNFILFAAALLLITGMQAQEEKPAELSLKRKFELSPALSLQLIRGKGYESMTMLSVPVRGIYFFNDHFGLGNEVLATITEDDYGVIFAGRTEYCFSPAGYTLPFISAGAGFSNGAFPVDRTAAKIYSTPLAVVFIGTGVKSLLNNSMLFRFDLQFRHFSGNDGNYSLFSDSDPVKIRVGYLECTFGVSILL